MEATKLSDIIKASASTNVIPSQFKMIAGTSSRMDPEQLIEIFGRLIEERNVTTCNETLTESMYFLQNHNLTGEKARMLFTTYRLKGQYHHRTKPAVKSDSGYEVWYSFGKRHRVDGPARIIGKTKEYYIEGYKLSEEEFTDFRNWLKDNKHVPYSWGLSMLGVINE